MGDWLIGSVVVELFAVGESPTIVAVVGEKLGVSPAVVLASFKEGSADEWFAESVVEELLTGSVELVELPVV